MDFPKSPSVNLTPVGAAKSSQEHKKKVRRKILFSALRPGSPPILALLLAGMPTLECEDTDGYEAKFS